MSRNIYDTWDEELFACCCGSGQHVLQLLWDREDNDIYFEVNMPYVSFWHRLWEATKYLFRPSRNACFFEFILKSKDTKRMVALLSKQVHIEEGKDRILACYLRVKLNRLASKNKCGSWADDNGDIHISGTRKSAQFVVEQFIHETKIFIEPIYHFWK